MSRQSANERARIAQSYNELYSQFSSETPGDVGNYQVLRPVGKGAFGQVYLAVHRLTRTKVVLKTASRDDPNLVREVFYHRQFEHPNITRLYEVVKADGLVWLVLEYCPNSELYDYVLSCGRARVPLDHVRRLFAQITSAVYYAHSINCIHRDLKLENILLDKHNNAKLSDFGFTRECQHRALLETVCGTTAYMAPELISKKKYDGFKVDVWSLGVILFTLVYGFMPFDDDDDALTRARIVRDDPRYDQLPDVPPDAKRLIASLLCKNPQDRISCADILRDPFLAPHGQHGLDVSDAVLRGLHTPRFASKSEKSLLKKLRSAGIDTHALQKSVLARSCDPLYGLWFLLLEKEKRKQARKYKTRSRSVLRISESTSRRVSQLVDPPLKKMISAGSQIIQQPQPPAQQPQPQHLSASPEKKKPTFIQKFSKLLKISSSSSQPLKPVHSRTASEPHNTLAQPAPPRPAKLVIQEPPRSPAPATKNIQFSSAALTPPTPTTTTNGSANGSTNGSANGSANGSSNSRPRPLSMLSQHSTGSQFTTMSDLSVGSLSTSQSESTAAKPLYQHRKTDKRPAQPPHRSLSLISSNSSTSEKSSAKGSLYDAYSSDFKPIYKSRETVFPTAIAYKRRKSPITKLRPSSKFKKSHTIEEEEDMEDVEDETDLDNLTRHESSSDESVRGRQM